MPCPRSRPEAKPSSRGRSRREAPEVGPSAPPATRAVVAASNRGRRRTEDRGGRQSRVSNKEAAAASAAGASGHSSAGYSKLRASKETWGWWIWVGITKMRFRAQWVEVTIWDKPRGACRAYLGQLAQLLTPQVAQQVTTQILTLGTCHEGGRAGPKGAQTLGPGFPAQRPHGQARRSLQGGVRGHQIGGRETRRAPNPLEGARAPAPNPKGPRSPEDPSQIPATLGHS